MGSRLGRRVVNFANLPIKLQLPSSLSNVNEFSLKTICSASKIEIKRVLESLYGFDVDEVRTLNMDGKKKKRGGKLFSMPDYKKAYITLRTPLSISRDLYPIQIIEDSKKAVTEQSKSRSGTVEEKRDDPTVKSHWLDDKRGEKGRVEIKRGGYKRGGDSGSGGKKYGGGGGGGGGGSGGGGGVKFPWSSMRGLNSK